MGGESFFISALLLYGIAGILINCIILGFVIRTATETKKKMWIVERQLNVLIKIAEKSGVSTDEINDALK